MACAAAALLCACAGNRAATGSLTQTLQPCETREVSLDGTTLVLHANADAKLGSIEVASAPDPAQRAAALADVQKTFGPAHPDDRVMQRPGKWGLSVLTDPCGRVVTPAPLFSPHR
ncbi:MAG: hypothetical protein ACLQPV_06530 [Vulcanimicrobiaceae bacterium]